MAFRLTLYAVFILSGAAGLFYEALWARYLGLLVGHSAYAQLIVLTIFMGGMGAGALLVGARTRRLADPLAWYARVELLIGVLGALFDPVFRWLMQAAYDTLLPAAGSGFSVALVKWGIGALVILPQSVLLGMTFPLMSAGLLRRHIQLPGRTLGLLYFTNSLGAAIGVLLAGFWLLSVAGLPGTLLVATGLNVLAAGVTFVLAQRHPPSEPTERLDAIGTAPATPAMQTLGRVLLAVAFGTALASFIYEVAWIRMLSLVLSSATHAFELMLSAFIFGIALGAFWVRKRADRWQRPARVLGILQVAMGVAALATLPLYGWSFEWMAAMMRAFSRSDGGYTAFSVGRYGISLAIMLAATFCAGTTLPLITRILLAQGAGEPAIGRVYGLNTLGSIGGAMLAGLVLLPVIGLKHTVLMGAALDIGLGILVLWAAAAAVPSARRWEVGAFAAAGIALVAITLVTPDFDPRLLASAVYREGIVPPPGSVQTLFHEDGRTATVTVHRREGEGLTVISTNGKPDASLPDYWVEPCSDTTTRRPLDSDVASQALTPLITLAHAPSARTVAVVGFGSGMSTQFLLDMPTLDTVVTIEIEPAMVRGARAFYPTNRRAYEDPRSTIVYDDAKSYFSATGRRFDVIYSEPSNPWVSGVSSLFTTEFYERITRALTPNGVFGQWLHLYELDDGLVLSVLAAVHQNFRSYVVYQSWGSDLVIVATNGELSAPAWRLFAEPDVQAGLCHTLPLSGGMLDAARLLDRTELAPLLDDWGQANSDYYPVLDLGAERTRYLRTSARGFAQFAAARFDVVAALRGNRLAPVRDTAAPVPGIARMQAQATAAGLRVSGPHAGALDGNGLARARFVVDGWRGRLADGNPPADWLAWLQDFATVERLVHGAARGTAREGFYDSTRVYLDRADAPATVRAAVDLRHALAAWDFPAAVRAGDVLQPTVLAREGLYPPDEYLDAMVTANLMTGDVRSAGRVFGTVGPLTGRSTKDFRMLLLASYLRAMERMNSGAEQAQTGAAVTP